MWYEGYTRGRQGTRNSWTSGGGGALNGAAWLAAAVVGAGLMYLFDPVSGRRRRALLRDKMGSTVRQSRASAGNFTRHTADHLRGLAIEARARMTEGEVPDRTLVERVRSQMGRAIAHPSSTIVEANNGVVTLRGAILAHEVDDLLGTVRSVRGVKEVQNQMTVRERGGDVPGLQGEGSRQSGG